MKIPLTLDRIFNEQPTKSILNLLYGLSKEKDKGLRPMELLFAFQKGYIDEGNIDIEYLHNIRRTKELFGNVLIELEKKNEIERDCIKSKGHLNYYLEKLVNDFKILKKLLKFLI